MNYINLVNEISRADKESLDMILGPAGYQIKQFLESVDLDHPDLDFFIESLFFKEDNFTNKDYIDLFKTIRFIKSNNHLGSLNIFSKALSKLNKKNFNKHNNVRLIKKKDEREKARLLRSPQHIDLYFFQKEFRNSWEDFPDNFDTYLKNDITYKSKIDLAIKKKEIYENIGCNFLAKEIQHDIEDIEKHNIMYYGFHQIKISTAAIILAKKLNYIFNEDSISIKNFFDSDSKDFFNYTPYAYPISYFWDISSDRIKNQLNSLEHYTENNCKPTFDLFFLVVPGFDFLSKNSKGYSFKGSKSNYKAHGEALKESFKYLLENKIIQSVVLGEKDGLCYFIDFFDPFTCLK